MRNLRTFAVAMTMALALGACTGTTVDDTTASSVLEDAEETASSLAEEGQFLAAEIETELDELQTAVENSDAADALESDFDAMRTAVVEALTTMTEDGMIDAPDLSDEFDDFQSNLDALGDDVGTDVQDAWNSLRTTVETMMG